MNKLLLNFTLDTLPLSVVPLPLQPLPTSYHLKTQFPWLTAAYSQNENTNLLPKLLFLVSKTLTRNAFCFTASECSPALVTDLNLQTFPLPFLHCNGCHMPVNFPRGVQITVNSLSYFQEIQQTGTYHMPVLL